MLLPIDRDQHNKSRRSSEQLVFNHTNVDTVPQLKDIDTAQSSITMLYVVAKNCHIHYAENGVVSKAQRRFNLRYPSESDALPKQFAMPDAKKMAGIVHTHSAWDVLYTQNATQRRLRDATPP